MRQISQFNDYVILNDSRINKRNTVKLQKPPAEGDGISDFLNQNSCFLTSADKETY